MQERPISRVLRHVADVAHTLSGHFAPEPDLSQVKLGLHDHLKSNDQHQVRKALKQIGLLGEEGGEFVHDLRRILKSGNDMKTIERAVTAATRIGPAGSDAIEEVGEFCQERQAGMNRPIHPRTRTLALDAVDALGINIIKRGDEAGARSLTRVLPLVADASDTHHPEVHFAAIATYRHLSANAILRQQKPVIDYVTTSGLPALENAMAADKPHATGFAREALADLRSLFPGNPTVQMSGQAHTA